MRKSIKNLIGSVVIAFSLLAFAPANAQQEETAPACNPFSDVKSKNEGDGWRLVALTDAQAAAVVADFNEQTQQTVEADAVWIATHPHPTKGAQNLTLVVFVNKGCYLGAVAIDPPHLVELLGRSA